MLGREEIKLLSSISSAVRTLKPWRCQTESKLAAHARA
jgi:hypothetical protein